MIGTTTLNGLTTANDAFVIDIEGVITAGQATDELTMRVSTGSGFTTYDLSVAVLGTFVSHAGTGKVALIFGNEQSGLSNDQLSQIELTGINSGDTVWQ